jgi:general secretion pathway protein A
VESASPPPAIEKVVAQVPAPAPSPPKNVDIAELLTEHSEATTPEAAFAQLLALWDAKSPVTGTKPCEQLPKQGLECVYQKGSWGELMRLNRPAILTLADDGGAEHKILLTGLSADTASINLDGTSYQVSVGSMARAWLGDYLIVWRPPALGQRPLTVGMRGDSVKWLRSSLRTAQGQSNDAPVSDVFDNELARMVEDFQRRHRLEVDGVAGVQTQLLLDALAHPSAAPRLLAATAGG